MERLKKEALFSWLDYPKEKFVFQNSSNQEWIQIHFLIQSAKAFAAWCVTGTDLWNSRAKFTSPEFCWTFASNPRHKECDNHTHIYNEIIFIVCRNKQSCIKGGGKAEAVPSPPPMRPAQTAR